MTEENQKKLPEISKIVTEVIAGAVDALTPRALKAFDRLLGAGVDIPAAWLEQHADRIRSKTRSLGTVDAAIAEKAGQLAASNEELAERAMLSLVRKEYRRTANREATVHEAAILLNDRSSYPNEASQSDNSAEQIDGDWLNVFERFAEDSSSERMQKLWGRVLAGEIRKPGAFSLRALRFLSEFSQQDALFFADFCKNTVGDTAPKSLVIPEHVKDIRHLLRLEAAGLITGATGLGLSFKGEFNAAGNLIIREADLGLILRGTPNTLIEVGAVGLTPLGVEIVSLVPDRDPRDCMRRFALAIKSPQTTAALIGHFIDHNTARPIEQIWLDQAASEV